MQSRCNHWVVSELNIISAPEDRLHRLLLFSVELIN